MEFCGNGTAFTPVWKDKGLNHCFTDTISSSVLFVIGVVFGSIELMYYKRYSNRVEQMFLHCSCLFVVQLTLEGIMVCESVANVLIHSFWLNPGVIVPYRILSSVFLSLAWLFSIFLIFVERHRMLPTIPTRGHGLVLVLFWMIAFAFENVAFISWQSPQWWWQNRDQPKTVEMTLWGIRYVGSALLFIIGFAAPGLPKFSYTQMTESMHVQSSEDDIENPLMGRQNSGSRAANRGETNTWKKVGKKITQIWPLIWPKNSLPLQLNVIFCVLLLVAGRVVNVYTPIFSKKIVNSLSLKNTSSFELTHDNLMHVPGIEFRWDYILIYVLLWCMQGGGFGSMGLLNNMRSLLWVWVQQYTTKATIVKLFAHLHSLSLRWHLSRKTGSVLSIMDRGTNSVNNILSYVIFQIVPTVADILIACIFFLLLFNVWFALIVFGTMVLYLVATIAITEWRTKYRREMNMLDNERNARGVDSLLNFETVKYYGAEEFEVQRYRDAIVAFQKAEFTSNATLNVLNVVQNVIITVGLLTGLLLCAWYIYTGQGFTVGDYVLFSTYVIQLYQPLNFFGTYYRMIQQAFIDMENMFDLLDEQAEIRDVENAPELMVAKGMIEFNNVNFHYDPSKPILKNVTFVVPPGQTYALVGHSGSGKSTIVRLLFRFYDIQSGVIRIDGQDITHVKQTSLRKAIGVVPQDTVLFNSDIRYNIRYGRVTASDEEVEEAAKAAEIHTRILTFPDKYNTKVGERGLKLSGGEKQRVAIARTILKAPKFVLLDEATSALDTQTERNIQASLSRVCENRTTLVVAHRLSTIVNADQILVLKEGEIIERGTHDALLASGGAYASMWQQQLTKTESDASTNSGSDEGETSSKMADSQAAKQPAAGHPHGGAHGHGHGGGH